MTVPDFSKIWASQSPLTPYEFSDEDYLDGWEFLGEIPPDRRMFDAWQRQADTKMQWLKNNMLGYLLRQNSTQYAVGDIAFSASLPSSLVLECTTPGTTAATEPDFSGAAEGNTVTDGKVVWTYKTLVGGGLDREQIPAFNHRDVITTSGTYTAPVNGWYKITVKGGGGGGGGGLVGNSYGGGFGGGEGGTTIAYEYMTAGQTAAVVIGAGGIGGAYSSNGSDGGASSVTVDSSAYSAGGGGGGGRGLASASVGGAGGAGTIYGAPGGTGETASGTAGNGGGAGGAAGSWVNGNNGVYGGGGAGGGVHNTSNRTGGNGGDGYVWFEYFAEV